MQKNVKPRKTRIRKKVIYSNKPPIIKTILRKFINKILKKKYAKNNKFNHYIIYSTAVILILFFIWLFTHKNAYHVMVDDVRIGTISKNRNITGEDILNSSISNIQFELNSNISTEQSITLIPVRSSRRNLSGIDNLISKISQVLDYKVEGFSIVVDGIDIAVAPSKEIADNILKSILERYEYEDTSYVSTTFLEKVDIVAKYFDQEDIMSEERIRVVLNATTTSQNTYTVKEGDSLSKIANNFGSSISDIVEINDNINQSTTLQINQEILVLVPKPVLSVETRTEVKYTEIIKKNVQTVQSPNQDRGTSTILQQGSDGQKEITAHIIRINGIEVGQEIVNEEIIIEPIDEVIQIGTR